MMRRRGPGLVRMAATTAVVAGTAGAVSHHQQQKYANQAAAAAGRGRRSGDAAAARCHAAGRSRPRRRPRRAGRPDHGPAPAPGQPPRPGHPERRGVRGRQGEGARHLTRERRRRPPTSTQSPSAPRSGVAAGLFGLSSRPSACWRRRGPRARSGPGSPRTRGRRTASGPRPARAARRPTRRWAMPPSTRTATGTPAGRWNRASLTTPPMRTAAVPVGRGRSRRTWFAPPSTSSRSSETASSVPVRSVIPPSSSIVHGIVPLRAILARRVLNAAHRLATVADRHLAAGDADVGPRPVEGRGHQVARRGRAGELEA